MADVVDWSVGDVCAWAATCDLAHLEEVLRRNRVDGPALAVVTREEIRDELQVEAYLDRRRLWDAVLKLRTSTATASSSSAGSLPLPPLLASASTTGLGDDGADVESQLSSSACATPATHSHADPSGGWPTPLLSPLEATGSSSFYSFAAAPLNASGSSLARASSSHATCEPPQSPGSNGLGRSLARSFSEQDAGGGGAAALSRSLSLGGRSSPTAGSADGSSQHSLSLRARRMHTLALNEENRVPSPQLELTVSHLTSLLQYQVTADSIGALLCAGPDVHLEMLVRVLARLIYGLVGKRSPSRSVLEHDPLPTSALTLLRSYGYGGSGGEAAGTPSAGSEDAAGGGQQLRPATLLSAARAMQSLPLGRFVRDALRVCEGVGAVKGTRAPLTQQDVAAFVQVFSLRDLLLQLEAPPPPPLPQAEPPAALKKQQRQQQQEASSGKTAASPSPTTTTTTTSASAVDADTLLASMRAAARLDTPPDAASGVVTLDTLLCAVFRDLTAPASSMPSPHDPLPPSAAVMLGVYGLAPGRTTSETAAGVLAAPPQDARRLVGDLLKVLQVRTHADLAALVAASASSSASARTTRPRPPAGSAAAAGARPATVRGGGGGGGVGVPPTTGATPPQVGRRVRVKRCAEEVELHCRRNARIGWDVDMAAYVGAEGCVGKLAGGGSRVRVVHDDGAVWTWPVDVIEDAAAVADATAGNDCVDDVSDAAVVVVAAATATAAGEDGAAERAAPGASWWGLRGRGGGGRQPEAAPAAKPEMLVEEELQAV